MTQRDRVIQCMQTAQQTLISAFEALDGQATFEPYSWERPGGGGGRARVLEQGKVFERAGVNWSAVHGDRVPASLAKEHPQTEGLPFFATGVSMVLHPQNPYVPSFHANYRYFETGSPKAPTSIWWFGGGADLTPYYGFEEDARHFHHCLKAQCDAFDLGYYPRFKETCDDYFYIKHRQEMRGIGGIFFDELQQPGNADFEHGLAFITRGFETILEAYVPIVERRQHTPYGERERQWQLYRRGRYVEFNLVYDRGTLFGLQTSGNIEAILMSMPSLAHWRFNYQPEPDSPEAAMFAFLQPRDWVS